MNSLVYLTMFLGVILVSGTVSSQAFGDVISPRQQIKLGFTAQQVICSEGMVKITQDYSGKVSCVKPVTAEKLAENGWAKQLSEQKIEEIEDKKMMEGEQVGTIKKIAVLKQLSLPVKAGISSNISGYSYIFDACSADETIRTPEIFVTSDSDTKSVKLGSMLKPNSCYTSSVIIKAADPNSISADLLNKGEISAKITSLETQIAELKDQIVAAKQKIPKSEDQEPDPKNLNSIASMKKELKGLQDQLRRYLMVLYVPPNLKATEIHVPKSVTGQPLEGMTTGLVSITESVVKPESENADLKRFNVVFEACSGKETIRLPIIEVVSDSDSIDIKLVERIIPQSCQVGVAKINAIDVETITTKISGNSGVSKQIATLEKQIDGFQTKLADKRSELGTLVSKKLDSSGEEMAETLAMEISELRADLLETRTKLYGLMLGK